MYQWLGRCYRVFAVLITHALGAFCGFALRASPEGSVLPSAGVLPLIGSSSAQPMHSASCSAKVFSLWLCHAERMCAVTVYFGTVAGTVCGCVAVAVAVL